MLRAKALTKWPARWVCPIPAAPSVANAAKTGDPKAYRLPVPHVEGKIQRELLRPKTAVLNEVNQAKMKDLPLNVPDLAASFQGADRGHPGGKAAGCRCRHRRKTGLPCRRCGCKWAAAPAGERRRPEAGRQGLPAGAEVLRRQRRYDRRTRLLPVYGRAYGPILPERSCPPCPSTTNKYKGPLHPKDAEAPSVLILKTDRAGSTGHLLAVLPKIKGYLSDLLLRSRNMVGIM